MLFVGYYYAKCNKFGIIKMHVHVMKSVVNDLKLPKHFIMSAHCVVKIFK